MGSKQSKQIEQPIPVTENPMKEIAAETAPVKSKSKLPFSHPTVTSTEDGECPYKNPLQSIGGLFKKKQEIPDALKAKTEKVMPAATPGCPVKAPKNTSTTESSASSGECPVKVKGKSTTQYNVYSQPIDPNNNMPSVANQLPSPTQNEMLSTERIRSTIPKGGSDADTWTYPSPQMFYNSLSRKNKLGDTEESDIASVVAIHNNMNEKTWSKVMEWEQVLCPEAEKEGGAKLLKFLGRPSDLSPKAWVKNKMFGHPLPFDRHDWTILRPNGTEVTYVIDYYVDETKADEREGSGFPNMHDRNAIESILVDVRPAADSVENLLGRAVIMPYARRVEKSTKFEPMSVLPTSEMKAQIGESEKVWENIQNSVLQSKKVAEAKSMILKADDIPDDQKKDFNLDITDEEARGIAKSFVTMLDTCKSNQKLINECKDEADCAKASLALTMCLAKVVCPIQQGAVSEALNADDFDANDAKSEAAYNERFETALENMTVCVTGKSQRAAAAKRQYPELFQKASQ